MSSGRVHSHASNQLRLPVAILLGVFIFYILGWQAGLLATVMGWLGCYLALFITPDMDIIERSGNYTLWEVKKRYGTLASKFWLGYWWCYGKVTHHRGIVSHTPIISTIIRFIYFLPLLFPFWIVMYYQWDAILYMLCGIIICDCFHILLDYHLSFRAWYEKAINLH